MPSMPHALYVGHVVCLLLTASHCNPGTTSPRSGTRQGGGEEGQLRSQRIGLVGSHVFFSHYLRPLLLLDAIGNYMTICAFIYAHIAVWAVCVSVLRSRQDNPEGASGACCRVILPQVAEKTAMPRPSTTEALTSSIKISVPTST